MAARKPTTKSKVPAKAPVQMRDLKRVKGLIAKAKMAGVEEAPSYGMPSLKVMGKFMARVREPGVLVVMCALEEKEFLMQTNPDVYFETDHYKGWPAVLVRLPKIDDEELIHRLWVAWRKQAPKRFQKQIEAAAEAKPSPPRAKAKKAR